MAKRRPGYHAEVNRQECRIAQITEQSLAAARARLLTAGINPDDKGFAENAAFMIEEERLMAERRLDQKNYDGTGGNAEGLQGSGGGAVDAL
jgi:hypothetical protein